LELVCAELAVMVGVSFLKELLCMAEHLLLQASSLYQQDTCFTDVVHAEDSLFNTLTFNELYLQKSKA